MPLLCAGKKISPWHEIPLYAGDGLLHYICEIPKETSAKMEVATVSSSSSRRVPLHWKRSRGYGRHACIWGVRCP